MSGRRSRVPRRERPSGAVAHRFETVTPRRVLRRAHASSCGLPWGGVRSEWCGSGLAGWASRLGVAWPEWEVVGGGAGQAAGWVTHHSVAVVGGKPSMAVLVRLGQSGDPYRHAYPASGVVRGRRSSPAGTAICFGGVASRDQASSSQGRRRGGFPRRPSGARRASRRGSPARGGTRRARSASEPPARDSPERRLGSSGGRPRCRGCRPGGGVMPLRAPGSRRRSSSTGRRAAPSTPRRPRRGASSAARRESSDGRRPGRRPAAARPAAAAPTPPAARLTPGPPGRSSPAPGRSSAGRRPRGGSPRPAPPRPAPPGRFGSVGRLLPAALAFASGLRSR